MLLQFSSVQFSRSVVSDSLQRHESQHARPPCPSPTPGVHSNSCPSSRWCHPAISSSVVPCSSCPQSLPASGFLNKRKCKTGYKLCSQHVWQLVGLKPRRDLNITGDGHYCSLAYCVARMWLVWSSQRIGLFGGLYIFTNTGPHVVWPRCTRVII